MEHHDGVAGGGAGDTVELVKAYVAGAEGVFDEATVSIVPDLADEVGGVGEAATAAGLVGALATGESLAGAGSDGLALAREAVDLYVDVGVGGAHHHHGGLLRGGVGSGREGSGGGEGGRGEGEVVWRWISEVGVGPAAVSRWRGDR